MSEKRDYYEVLGVAQDVSEKEIKKAFRKLAMGCHPDRLIGKSKEEIETAEVVFKEANEAHDVLKDEKRRAIYDKLGFEGLENYESGGSSAAPRKDYNWDDVSSFDFGAKQKDSWSDLGSKNKASEDGLTPAEKRKAARAARRAAKENGEEAPKTERQSGFNKTSSARKEAPRASTAQQQVNCVVVPVDTLTSAVAALKEAGQDGLAASLQGSLSSGRKTKSFRPK